MVPRVTHATIRDVARQAAVSVASVSRALNGHSNVRQDTRDRIVAAAESLGYVPHAGARSLSLSRAHAIGIVLPDLHGEFFSEVVRGMDRAARAHGLQLLLSNLQSDADQASQALRTMRGRVDGMVVMAPHLDPAAVLAPLPATTPAVLVNSRDAGSGRPCIRIDNRAGAEAIVRHLVESGRRHIVHIAGPEGNVDAEERAAGFREALQRHAPGEPPRILPGDFTEAAGGAAVAMLMADAAPVDAIFAANDMMAIGALAALRSTGRSPPRVAVAGFDDVPLARYLGLTTAQVRIADIGARAVDRLVDLIEHGVAGEPIELHPPELIVRETTAAA